MNILFFAARRAAVAFLLLSIPCFSADSVSVPETYLEYEAPAEKSPASGAAYHSDPTNNSRRTDHFIIRWGPASKDGILCEDLAQGHLQMLEHAFDNWKELGLRGIGGKDPQKQYKAVIMPGNTWAWDGPTGAVGFGEGPGVTGLHVPANCLAYLGGGNGCTPHECGHGWQNQGGLPPCQPQGWTESLANWYMCLFLVAYPSQMPAIGVTPNHACQCYNQYSLFNHFLDRPGYGTRFLNRLIFDPNLNSWQNRLADDIYRKAIRVDTSGSPDPAGTIHDELGLMAARMLDMDFWNRDFDREFAHKKDAKREFFFFNRTTMVRQPGVTGEWYRPEWICVPQAGANSFIPLTVTAARSRRTISCDLRPVSDALNASSFRACFVAFNRNNEPRYSRLWSAGENTFTLADDEEAVYLSVYALPKVSNWSIRNNDYTSRQVQMFPFRIRLAGAQPREFRMPAPAGGTHRHPNGGGLVASSAAVDASAFVGPDAATTKAIPQSYNLTARGLVPGSGRRLERTADNYVTYGGSLVATPEDLAKLLLLHLQEGQYGGKQIIPRDLMLAAHEKPSWSKTSYGLGWSLGRMGKDGRRATIGHSGSSGTYAWIDFEKQLVGVVFTQMPAPKSDTGGKKQRFWQLVREKVDALFATPGKPASTETPDHTPDSPD